MIHEEELSPTDTSYRLCIIHDLGTEEVSLAHDENSEDRSTKHRNFYGTQEFPNQGIYTSHLSDCGFRTRDWLVNPLIFISTTEAGLRVDLEDLVPHEYQREDGGDAARSCEERGRAELEFVWCGNDVDVVG